MNVADSRKRIRALIIGAGVGGLSAAVALQHAGIDATLFERSPDARYVTSGGGLTLWPNSTLALDRLGVGDQVRAAGTPFESAEFLTCKNELLARWPVGDLGRQLGSPAVFVSRADLQATLYRAPPPECIRLGAELVGFSQDEDGVTARFADGSTERGDLLIGADGIHSVVRGQQFGDARPQYAGYTIWQGNLDLQRAPFPEGVFQHFWGRGQRFIIHRASSERLFWMAVANAPEGERDAADGPRDALLARYRGWPEPAEAAIGSTENADFIRLDIFVRQAARVWTAGRVTLLGDAAHPITFNVGQGAAQAMEDAVVLAKCLTAESDVAAALRVYETRRRARATGMLVRARRLGEVARWENPIACWVRARVVKLIFNSLVWKGQIKEQAYEF